MADDAGSWKIVGIAIAGFFLLAGIAMTLLDEAVPGDTLALASRPSAQACAPSGAAPPEAPAGAAPPCPAPP